jgi:hypothetical protein
MATARLHQKFVDQFQRKPGERPLEGIVLGTGWALKSVNRRSVSPSAIGSRSLR